MTDWSLRLTDGTWIYESDITFVSDDALQNSLVPELVRAFAESAPDAFMDWYLETVKKSNTYEERS